MVGAPRCHGRRRLPCLRPTRMRRAKVRDRPHHTQPLVPRQGVTGPRPAPPRQRCEAFPARGVPALKVGGVDPSVPVRSVSKRLHAGRRAIDSAAFRRDHPPSRVALDDLGKEDRAPWTPPGPSARARGPGGAQGLPHGTDGGHQAIGTDHQGTAHGTAPHPRHPPPDQGRSRCALTSPPSHTRVLPIMARAIRTLPPWCLTRSSSACPCPRARGCSTRDSGTAWP